MKVVLLAIAATVLLGGCASAPSGASRASADGKYKCPTTALGLTDVKTEKHVVSCMGKPAYETSKPDGRHTGLYRFKGGLMVVFLYEENGNVIRNRVYQDNNSASNPAVQN